MKTRLRHLRGTKRRVRERKMEVTPTVRFTFDYWQHDGWYIGCLRELPGVQTQARTLEGLKAMLADAYVTLYPPGWTSVIEEEAGPPLGTGELEFPYVEEPLPLPAEDAAEVITREEAAEEWRQLREDESVQNGLAAAS